MLKKNYNGFLFLCVEQTHKECTSEALEVYSMTFKSWMQSFKKICLKIKDDESQIAQTTSSKSARFVSFVDDLSFKKLYNFEQLKIK